MKKYLFLLTILTIYSFTCIEAQEVKEAVTSVREARGIFVGTKKARLRKMDLFETRNFRPFFFVEGNLGLVSTFSKDKVYTVAAPISVGGGYRFSPKFSAVLAFGQSVYNSDMYYYDRSFKSLAQTRLQVASVMGQAHIPVGHRAELFGGFGLSYQDTDISALEEDPNKSNGNVVSGEERRIVRPQKGFYGTAAIGGRIALSPQLSIQANLGNGLSPLNGGIRYRFR